VDIQRISEFLYYHHYVWLTPITILIMMYVLWFFVGIASLAGFFTLVFLIILNFACVARSKKYEVSTGDKYFRLQNHDCNGHFYFSTDRSDQTKEHQGSSDQ
jgi:hypothetical protein